MRSHHAKALFDLENSLKLKQRFVDPKDKSHPRFKEIESQVLTLYPADIQEKMVNQSRSQPRKRLEKELFPVKS